MARIRTVKPELFRHEELFDIELLSGLPIRLAWIGLFTVADREGRFKWRARSLKAEILPFDDIDFEHVLVALEAYGLVVRYHHDNEEYGAIPSFRKHQCINLREAQSVLPAPPEDLLLACSKPTRYLPPHIKKPVHARASTESVQQSPPTVAKVVQPDTSPVEPPRVVESVKKQLNSNIETSDGVTTLHVHARGERKGKEKERKGTERKGAPTAHHVHALAAQAPLGKVVNSLSPKPTTLPMAKVIAAYCEGWSARYNSPRSPDITGKSAGLLKSLVNDLGCERVMKLLEAYLAMPDSWFVTKRHDIPTFYASLNSVALFADSGKIITKSELRDLDKAVTNENTLMALKAGEL